MKHILVLLFLSISTVTFAQQAKKIKIINAGQTYTSELYPDATIAIENVFVEIDGATIRCDRVEIYSKTNFLKAMGNVVINQGDTVIQTSKFVNYDGNKKLAVSWGNVVLKDPTMTLTTEKLNFDRAKQHLYYNSFGTIKDSTNVLTSSKGNYFLDSNKFQAFDDVVVVNPDQTLKTAHLEYFTDSGKAYLFRPSTITGDESVVYTEKGFHDTKTKISHLTKNSWIKYDDRLIEGDSLYYDETKSFSSATGNIKVTDTINNSILKGGYGEFYRALDSAYIVNRALAISLIEQDSLYIHGDTLLITGKPENRIIRAFHRVKIFKEDLRGKCDSLVSIQSTGLTKMYWKPVLWSQLTGDIIHFLSDTKTNQLDSLKILGNAFMVQIDSAGFNQTKGRTILGKFIDNDLRTIDVNGNAETIQYIRNEDGELIGIHKMRASKIHLTMENKKLNTVEYNGEPDGKMFPEKDIHVNDRKLKGFTWRESEKPLTKEDVFKHDDGDEVIIQQERNRVREQRLEELKDAERAKKRTLEMQKLQKRQDSIDATLINKVELKEKVIPKIDK